MSGSTPNVSLDNFKYSNLLIGGNSVLYDSAPLQQGVPIVDSDVNEMQDYRRLSEIMTNLALYGQTGARIALSEIDIATGGFNIKQSTALVNNFTVYRGFACVGGVIVPTTLSTPPASFEYKAQILYSGALTGIVGSYLEDLSKNWSSEDSLAASVVAPIHSACVIKIITGTEANHYAYIKTGYTTNTLEIDTVTPVVIAGVTYTGITPANLVIGNTYQILPPPLTTPVAARTDDVYLDVWYEDICDLEDADIVNPNVAIECVHKTAKRWAVRVSEGVAAPALSVSNMYGFGRRRMSLASLARTTSSGIIDEIITDSDACVTQLGDVNPLSIYFNQLVMASLDYTTTGVAPNVQACVDQIITDLHSTGLGLGTGFVGSHAISDTPSSLSAGQLDDVLAQLLGFVNDRVTQVHPTASITAPTAVWRSHNQSLTETTTITPDTVTIYLMPAKVSSPASRGNYAICVGCYLSGVNAGAPTGATEASMVYYGSSFTSFAYKDSGLASTWLWDMDTTPAWDTYYAYGVSGFTQSVNPTSFFGLTAAGDMGFTGRHFSVALAGNATFLLSGLFSSISTGDTTIGSLVYVNLSAVRAIRVAGPLLTLAGTVISPLNDPGAYDPQLILQSREGSGSASNSALWLVDDGIWLTSNVYWTGSAWKPHRTSFNSYGVCISPLGIIKCATLHDSPGYSGGWALLGWDSCRFEGLQASELGASAPQVRNCDTTLNTMSFERVHVSWVTNFQFTGPGVIYTVVPVNFRNCWDTAPTFSVVDPASLLAATNIVSVVYTHVDSWGGYVTITSDTVSLGDLISYVGHIDFFHV